METSSNSFGSKTSDGYIIGSYLNKRMLKELGGSNNTSTLNNSG